MLWALQYYFGVQLRRRSSLEKPNCWNALLPHTKISPARPMIAEQSHPARTIFTSNLFSSKCASDIFDISAIDSTSVVPTPSWPRLFQPHEYTEASLVRKRQWPPPPLICRILAGKSDEGKSFRGSGKAHSSLSYPRPSCPCELAPLKINRFNI